MPSDTRPYDPVASWQILIPCSNLLGKHGQDPPVCPVLDLISRGKGSTLPTAVVWQSGRNLETAGVRPTLSSPSNGQANNVNIITTPRNKPLERPIVNTPRWAVYLLTGGRLMLTKCAISCSASNPPWLRDKACSKPRMKMTMHDLYPARNFRVSGNLLLEITYGDPTDKMGTRHIGSRTHRQYGVQPTLSLHLAPT